MPGRVPTIIEAVRSTIPNLDVSVRELDKKCIKIKHKYLVN